MSPPVRDTPDRTGIEYVQRLGIVGGGQLGRMLGIAAAPLGIEVVVLDPAADCPAARVADCLVGGLHDRAALERLAAEVTAITIEIENVGLEILDSIHRRGTPVRPHPDVLRIIADKLTQKQFFLDHDIPVAPLVTDKRGGVPDGFTADRPLVEKLRHGGYDGRGVAIIPAGSTRVFSEPSLLEEQIRIRQELAVMTCTYPDGSILCYDPVEMVFDPALHLVSHVAVPADIPSEVAASCRSVACAAAGALASRGLTGLLAVELFVDTSGAVILNEVAPRPHNSGHLSIEAAYCSQFEQHLRAVTGLPPGDPTFHSAAVMYNIVAPRDCEPGPVTLAGVTRTLEIPGVHLHLYGKTIQHPGRKLGHLTVTAESRTKAEQHARRAFEALHF